MACTGLPAHVALLPDASVSLCTKGETAPDRTSGTVIYVTASKTPEVLAFYREQADKAGLKPGVSTPTSYSAIDGTRRTMMAMVADGEGGKRQVTLNWGVET